MTEHIFTDLDPWSEDELAQLSLERCALDHYDERWRLSSDPVRIAWQAREDEYAARKAAVLAHIAELP